MAEPARSLDRAALLEQIEQLEATLFALREQVDPPTPRAAPVPAPADPPRPARQRDPGSESEIQRAILVALGAREDLFICRRNVGYAKDPITGRVVKFGVAGEADLQGVLRVRPACPECGALCGPLGLAVAFEVKSRTGRQSEEQKTWDRAWTRRGGLYRLVRSVEDAQQALAQPGGAQP